MYALSLLDKSPFLPGESAVAALSNTVNLARKAEELGYRRFWVAEHHGVEEFILQLPALGADERLASVELLARKPLSAAA